MPVHHRVGAGDRWVLFLHGACADHRTFEAQVAAFDDADDLLLPDLRGQGHSVLARGARATLMEIVDDLATLLETLGSPRTIVVGHSFGSHIAQEFAVQHPELVDRLILIGCYDQHAERDLRERFRVAVTSWTVMFTRWSRFARFSANVASHDPAIRDYLFKTHMMAGKKVFLDLGRSGSRAKRQVDRYDVPLLLIRGENEYSSVLAQTYDRIAARSAVSHLVAIPDAGHVCHQERPEETNEAIRAFCAGHR